jgi:hypothetical protein
MAATVSTATGGRGHRDVQRRERHRGPSLAGATRVKIFEAGWLGFR